MVLKSDFILNVLLYSLLYGHTEEILDGVPLVEEVSKYDKSGRKKTRTEYMRECTLVEKKKRLAIMAKKDSKVVYTSKSNAALANM